MDDYSKVCAEYRGVRLSFQSCVRISSFSYLTNHADKVTQMANRPLDTNVL